MRRRRRRGGVRSANGAVSVVGANGGGRAVGADGGGCTVGCSSSVRSRSNGGKVGGGLVAADGEDDGVGGLADDGGDLVVSDGEVDGGGGLADVAGQQEVLAPNNASGGDVNVDDQAEVAVPADEADLLGEVSFVANNALRVGTETIKWGSRLVNEHKGLGNMAVLMGECLLAALAGDTDYFDVAGLLSDALVWRDFAETVTTRDRTLNANDGTPSVGANAGSRSGGSGPSVGGKDKGLSGSENVAIAQNTSGNAVPIKSDGLKIIIGLKADAVSIGNCRLFALANPGPFNATEIPVDFAVQCKRCLKWRILDEGSYERIRATFSQFGFMCECCDVDGDIEKNDYDLKVKWADDFADIPVAPENFSRITKLRSDFSRFDVIYRYGPHNVVLRSSHDVENFIQGSVLRKEEFSFRAPKLDNRFKSLTPVALDPSVSDYVSSWRRITRAIVTALVDRALLSRMNGDSEAAEADFTNAVRFLDNDVGTEFGQSILSYVMGAKNGPNAASGSGTK